MSIRDRSTIVNDVPHAAVVARTLLQSRREQLRNELLATVDSLHRRRADLVSEGFVADYVALDWLEWNGGALRLTVTGQNICEQLRARLD